MTVDVTATTLPSRDELVSLYDAVGWATYARTRRPCTARCRDPAVSPRLVEEALAPFESVPQKVLLTDDEPGQRAFYESLGFAETRDFDDGSLRAFVKFG